MAACGAEPCEHSVAFSTRVAAERAAELIRRGEADALVCGNDVLAAGAYLAARDLDRQVGGDLGVTGFGASAAGAFLAPALTTFDAGMAAAGRRLAEILLAEGPEGELGAPTPVEGTSHLRR